MEIDFAGAIESYNWEPHVKANFDDNLNKILGRIQGSNSGENLEISVKLEPPYNAGPNFLNVGIRQQDPITQNPQNDPKMTDSLPPAQHNMEQKFYHCTSLVAIPTPKSHSYKLCGKVFYCMHTLFIHQLMHTRVVDPPKYRMHYCPYPHKDQKNNPGDKCGKGFKDIRSHGYHMDTHTGNKTFICSICGKGFVQHEHLKKHYQSKIHKNIIIPNGGVAAKMKRKPRVKTGKKN